MELFLSSDIKWTEFIRIFEKFYFCVENINDFHVLQICGFCTDTQRTPLVAARGLPFVKTTRLLTGRSWWGKLFFLGTFLFAVASGISYFQFWKLHFSILVYWYFFLEDCELRLVFFVEGFIMKYRNVFRLISVGKVCVWSLTLGMNEVCCP